MKSMNYLHLPAVVFLSIALMPLAQANDRSVRGIMIPVASCQPDWETAGGLILYSWQVSSGQYAHLLCPMPINNIELGGEATDNDMSKFRVHYRDSDGMGTASRITVSFYKTTSSPFSFVGICNRTLATTSTTMTSTVVPCAHDLAAGGAFYGFSVEMVTSPGTTVEFMGIDFPG